MVRHRAAPLMAVVSLLLMTVAACSSITDSRRADHVRILVTGQSDMELTLVTSIDFGVEFDEQGNETIILGEADTVQVTLPVDRRVQFQGSDRVFVSLNNPSTTDEASVEMRILLDGSEVYRQSRTLINSSLRYMHFLF